MESCASTCTTAARSSERCITVSRSKDIHWTFLCVWKQSPNITQLFFLEKFLTLQYFHIFEFSSSSCLFVFGRFRCALVFLIQTLQYFHTFEFSSSSCLFGFGRFRCALVFFTDFVCGFFCVFFFCIIFFIDFLLLVFVFFISPFLVFLFFLLFLVLYFTFTYFLFYL